MKIDLPAFDQQTGFVINQLIPFAKSTLDSCKEHQLPDAITTFLVQSVIKNLANCLYIPSTFDDEDPSFATDDDEV